MESDFIQILKIESDDFVIDEEETILLKVDYWKDMMSQSRMKEYEDKIKRQLFGDKSEVEIKIGDDTFKYTPSEYFRLAREAESKYNKAYPHFQEDIGKPVPAGILAPTLREETDKDGKKTYIREYMTAKEFVEFHRLKDKEAKREEAEAKRKEAEAKKKPKKSKEKKKKKTWSEDRFFMNVTPSKENRFTEEKKLTPNWSFQGVSLENLEAKLEANEYKNLTDDEVSEKVAKLTSNINKKQEQIENKGRGSEKTYTKAAWKEYQKLITEVKELEKKNNSLPSMPTINDAKKIRSKSKLENLGLKVGATNSDKLKALQKIYKEQLQEAMNSRRAIIDKKEEIAEFNKKFRVGSTHAQNRLKSWIEQRDSLLRLISLRSQIAYVKFQNTTDELTEEEPEAKDFKDVPDSLYAFVSTALSDDDFTQLISLLEKLNVLHQESQGEKAKYVEDMKEKVSYRGGESEDHKDSFNDFLLQRLEKFFKPIKVNNNAVRDDMKRNIERHLEEIIRHDPENTAIIISEDVIESVNAEVNEKIKRDEDARENLKQSSNLLDNVFRNVKEFYNKFDYDVSQPRSQSSEDALLFRIISQEVAGMDSQETFDSLEERNFFSDKNLYKLAKIISILDEGRSEKQLQKALKISKRNQITNHRKVVKVLHSEYGGGEVGHRIFLKILREHGIDLPSVKDIKDATRKIVSRSKNIRGLEQELMDINKIFASPSMSDDISFLMNPEYVQQMLDLAERSYFNAIDEIDDDTNPDLTMPMKLERKKQIRDTFGRLAYVGQYLNAISRGTNFLSSVNNQIIVSTRVLENMSMTYPQLKSEYGDTLSKEVKQKIRKIVAGNAKDSEGKDLTFSRPQSEPIEKPEPKRQPLPEKPTKERIEEIRAKWRGEEE